MGYSRGFFALSDSCNIITQWVGYNKGFTLEELDTLNQKIPNCLSVDFPFFLSALQLVRDLRG
jgi:hypothetical protein